MRFLRDRATAVGAALALTIAAGGGTAGSAAASPTPPDIQHGSPQTARVDPRTTGNQSAPGKTTTSTVTLLTGDRFRVETAEDGTQQVNLLPDGQDAAGGTFSQFTLGRDTYVVPSEAVPYLGKTIDMRLFNVSYLVRAKLDDERSKTLPVKVTATKAKAEGLPATSVASATSGIAKAKVTKKDADGFGRLLAKQWRGASSDSATIRHPAGGGADRARRAQGRAGGSRRAAGDEHRQGGEQGSALPPVDRRRHRPRRRARRDDRGRDQRRRRAAANSASPTQGKERSRSSCRPAPTTSWPASSPARPATSPRRWRW